MNNINRGGSRISGRGSNNYIHKRGWVWEEVCPSCDSQGVWVNAASSSSGAWGGATSAFLTFAFI